MHVRSRQRRLDPAVTHYGAVHVYTVSENEMQQLVFATVFFL